MRDLIIFLVVVGLILFGCYEYLIHQPTLPNCIKSHEEERPFSGRMLQKTETVCDEYIQVKNPYYRNGII